MKKPQATNRIEIYPQHTLHYPWQLEALKVMAEAQYTSLVVARQSGKTELLIWMLMDFCFNYNKFPYPRAIVCGKTSESIFSTFFQRMHNQMNGLPVEVYHKRGSKEGTVHVNLYRPKFNDYAQLVFSGVGNVGAIRGGTYDLMLLDEYALYPKDAWNAVLRPAGKIRGAKAIFTGTPEGRNNPLYRETMLCKKEQAAGNKQYASIHLNAFDANVMSKEEIATERRAYDASGESHLYEQELMVRFDAIAVDEAPFNRAVMDLEDGHADISDIDKTLMHDKVRINVVCDIGKAGNCATWFWVRSLIDDQPLILAYEDRFNGLKKLIKYCMQAYGDYTNIRLVLPVDANQPSLEEGNTKAFVLNDYIKRQGWSDKIHIQVLNKVKNKHNLWQHAIQEFGLLRWDRDGHGIMSGLMKLSQVRFKSDVKTGWIRFGEPIEDGNQHAADALMYLFADKAETNEAQRHELKVMGGIDVGPVQTGKYMPGTGPKYPVRRKYRW